MAVPSEIFEAAKKAFQNMMGAEMHIKPGSPEGTIMNKGAMVELFQANNVTTRATITPIGRPGEGRVFTVSEISEEPRDSEIPERLVIKDDVLKQTVVFSRNGQFSFV